MVTDSPDDICTKRTGGEKTMRGGKNTDRKLLEEKKIWCKRSRARIQVEPDYPSRQSICSYTHRVAGGLAAYSWVPVTGNLTSILTVKPSMSTLLTSAGTVYRLELRKHPLIPQPISSFFASALKSPRNRRNEKNPQQNRKWHWASYSGYERGLGPQEEKTKYSKSFI